VIELESYPTLTLKRCGKPSILHFFNVMFWILFFLCDIISGIGFKSFWLRLLGPEHQPLKKTF